MLKTSPAFVETLVASMIDLLQRGRPVHLPGVGTWSVKHTPAKITKDGSGDSSVPPQDNIVFLADPE